MDDSPFPTATQQGTDSAAEVLLKSMKVNGIDYMFVNPGTDFAPLIEGLAAGKRKGAAIPNLMVIPHENCAVAMAHGFYMVSGQPQAVMVHTNVGTANTLNCLADASRENVPILLMAGRNPITEQGVLGSRNGPIHWGQEMFDQAGMLREFVKWDYEMRMPLQAEGLVSRALEVMMSSPRGSAYLTLPREALGGGVPPSNQPMVPRAHPSVPHPDPAAIATLAGMIAKAERPLIITAAAGRRVEGALALARVTERFAIPVISFNARYVCLPTSHPMHLGFQPRPLLSEADLVIVLDTDVPWYPSQESPPPGCRIVHIGDDPAFSRYPMRSFPSDLTIQSGTRALLQALEPALAARLDETKVARRKAHLAARSEKLHAGWQAEIENAGRAAAITPPWVNHCLREVIDADTLVVNEYSFRQEYCPLEHPGSLFSVGPAGGLGWGLPAALGLKLAAPEKLVLALLGDGAYMFANPTACHVMSAAQKLPTLSVIYNNALYGAVRRATLDMYPKGAAAEADGRLLADLENPPFEKIIEAHGGHGERVERPADLPAALRRAAAMVRGGRQALVNVIAR